MCGICGFISKRNISLDLLNQMNDTMIHRGPDDRGADILQGDDGYHIGMAHRRLSIIDLSPKGHQPMYSPDRRVTVVFNGEIYNYMELRDILSPYPFVSTSDTEVIIAGYLKWGIDFLDHIHGMFAIALYDRKKAMFYLIRDRIGKKPLYYWYQNDELFFASELKPIMECPWFPKKINNQILSRYLFQRYINAPESIFENVRKVEPGMYISCFMNGNLEISGKKYWDINEVYHRESENEVHNFHEAKEGLKERLSNSVKKRLVADVPIGCLLSGGIDSSLITAVAQSLSEQPLKTFTIGFSDPDYNEAQYAKEIASYLGTDHTELYIDESEMIAQVRSIPQYYDEPFADSSQIPTMLVSRLVREKATVCLSGDGGDEFFCGYRNYELVQKAQRLDKLGAAAYEIGRLSLGGTALNSLYPAPMRKIAGNRDRETQAQLNPDRMLYLAKQMVAKHENQDNLSCQYPWESKYQVKNWVLRSMLLDMETALPEDMLCKVDRGAMKYSVETRNPLLDTNVMEYSFRIPQKYKFYRGIEKKYILKQLAYDYIPRKMLERPKKGFSVPLAKWLKGPLREQLTAYGNSDFLKRQDIFDHAFTGRLIHTYVNDCLPAEIQDANIVRFIWGFFVFQQWYEKYIKT
jgi:asparagine synthase (glutamine-hydrolysing)